MQSNMLKARPGWRVVQTRATHLISFHSSQAPYHATGSQHSTSVIEIESAMGNLETTKVV